MSTGVFRAPLEVPGSPADLAWPPEPFESAAFARFTGEIRHELGNPVNSIKAALTLIRRAAHLPSEKLTGYHDAMLSELERVERLLETLRQLGDPPRVFPHLGDLRELGTPLLEERRGELAGSGIRLEVAAGAMPMPIWVDRAAFERVLASLLRNAVEALAGVDEPRIEVGLCARGAFALLQVHDNGCGIAPAHLPLVCDPLFSTKRGAGGLGLYLARRQMRDMEGTLVLDSGTGQGTQASALFPLAGQPCP